MTVSPRKGTCPVCGYTKCTWYGFFEPCQRSAEQIAEWRSLPPACKACGEMGRMALGEGKGPHVASFVCSACGGWNAWVPKWRLALLLKK